MKHNAANRSPESILLTSRTATNINSTGNRASFKLRQPITIPNNLHAYISLTALRYNNVFYSVPKTKDVFAYRISSDFYSTLHTIVLNPGNYSVATLLNGLNLGGIDHGFVFTYDPVTFFVNIKNETWGFQIAEESTIMDILGIESTSTGQIDYTGTRAINLSGISTIDITMPSLGLYSNGVDQGNSSVILSVMNNVAPGYAYSVSQANPIQFKLTTPVITEMEVAWIGDGEDIDFLGSPWTIQLNIVYVYRPVHQMDASFLGDIPTPDTNPTPASTTSIEPK